ncbi:MAG: LysR family transcriptional regulator [Alphaproteobacteria bacterium]
MTSKDMADGQPTGPSKASGRAPNASSDTLLSRTFLEVVASGSFGRAAEGLAISQAAVSLRIQTLETQLGCRLFARGRGGARLTPAGHTFHRHAQAMKQVWDQAMLDVALPEGFEGQIRLGGHYSLWRHFLVRWLGWIRERGPAYAVRTEAHGNDVLMQHLGEGMLDIGVMFDPQQMRGFRIERLFDETLVLVSTARDGRGLTEPGYIFVDWGPAFYRFHLDRFPEIALPGIQTNLGSFALDFVLAEGGAGFFPEPVVRSHIDAGRLFRVTDTPVFHTPIYAVVRDEDTDPMIDLAVEGLRHVAGHG